MFTPTPEDQPQLGATLRAMREAADISLTEMAKRLGTDKSTISRFERGERLVGDKLMTRILRVIANLDHAA